jgi:RHS repeat-associated protein
LTDATGDITEQYTYDVFGTATVRDGSGSIITNTAIGNRFLFTGRELLAEIGLHDYRNRKYSEALGRFLQTEPLRFEAEDRNLYRYVWNKPVNLVDPSGLVPCPPGQVPQTDMNKFWLCFAALGGVPCLGCAGAIGLCIYTKSLPVCIGLAPLPCAVCSWALAHCYDIHTKCVPAPCPSPPPSPPLSGSG